jgi:glycosyltransferase involved in cell wall biosynthesis
MRVAFDATAIPSRRVGVGVYVTELLRCVREVDLHVFVRAADADELAGLLGDVTIHPVSLPNRTARIAWTHGVLPLRLRRLRPDVFHGPHYEVPSGVGCPSVVTFHDPTFFTSPEIHERAKVVYFTRMARTGVRRATRVIAVSDYARRGAIEHAGADPGKVDVVYEGVDRERYRPAQRYEDGSFVFFVGALAPHKNVPSLVRAFAAVDPPGELLIAGLPAWGSDAVDAAIAAAHNRHAIRLLGFISDERKITHLQQATVFVYPSLLEGFGLPVLEALACGAPVITTTGSAPEEFATGAAVLVAPGDDAALQGALRDLLADASRRNELSLLGPQRAASFTWDAAAAATVEVWKRAAG